VDANGGSPASLTAVHKTLYFTAADSSGDSQLWKSDGTDAGTARVAGPSGGGGANPYGLLAVRDRLYFVATDGGDERWMTTDGTTTEILGGADPVESNPFFGFGGAVAGDRLFLVYHSPGPDGSQLWRVSGLPPAPDPDPDPDPDPGPGNGGGGGGTNGGGTGGGGGTPPAPTPPTTPTPPAPTPPAAALKLTVGRFALDRRRGTATFALSYPAAATVKVSGPGVKTSTVKLRGKRVTVKVRPSAKLMRTLKRRGKATVTLKISCQPASGKRVTVKRKVTLVRR
jgi:ELWxxDGT repeat protein